MKKIAIENMDIFPIFGKSIRKYAFSLFFFVIY